jgi:hypothetical protein
MSYDQLLISGNASFDGSLEVSLINNFMPQSGDSFNILDFAGSSGTFNSILVPALSPGLMWNTSQLYTAGVLSVAAAGVPGDYNNNGTVDAADYILWRENNNTATTLPNDSTAGTNDSDYIVWRAHFGQTAGSGSGAGARAATDSLNGVPEPHCLLLLIGGSSLSAAQRRRKRPFVLGYRSTWSN